MSRSVAQTAGLFISSTERKFMDKKLFRELTGALKDAAAFERGEKINLCVAKLPPPKPLQAPKIILPLSEPLAN